MYVISSISQYLLHRLTQRVDLQQIARKCRSVQPKIQKWIEESAETDPGAIGESRSTIV